MQVMTEFVVLIAKFGDSSTKTVHKTRQCIYLRLKIACHYAHILKIYNGSSLNMLCVWYFCQAHFVLFVLKPEQREVKS